MLVLFSLLIAGYFQDKKVSEMIRNLWSIKDITDNFLLLFHLFDIFSEIVSFPGILVLIWTWSNFIPWRIWCLYQSLPGTLSNHQVISNFNWFFKEGGKGVSGHFTSYCYWPLILTMWAGDLGTATKSLGKPAVSGSERTEVLSYIKRVKREVKSNHQMIVKAVWPK